MLVREMNTELKRRLGKGVRTIIGDLYYMTSLYSQNNFLDVSCLGKAGKFCFSEIQVFDLAKMYFVHKCARAWEGFLTKSLVL